MGGPRVRTMADDAGSAQSSVVATMPARLDWAIQHQSAIVRTRGPPMVALAVAEMRLPQRRR